MQAERAAEQPQVAQIEAESQELFVVNQQLNKQQLTLAGEVRSMKQQSNSLADQAAQAKFDLLNANQVGAHCRATIVCHHKTTKVAAGAAA